MGAKQWPDTDSGDADASLIVELPVSDRLSGDIIMQDPLAELESVLVDIQVTSNSDTLLNQTYELKQPGGAGRQVLTVRLPEGTTPVLRYQERCIYKDGGVDVEPWQEAVSPHLLVGVPADRVKTISVRWLGPDPSAIGVSLVLVDLRYEDPAGGEEFTQTETLVIDSSPDSQIQEWKLRLPDENADSFQWRTNFFFDDGTNVESEFQTTNRSPLLIRPLG